MKPEKVKPVQNAPGSKKDKKKDADKKSGAPPAAAASGAAGASKGTPEEQAALEAQKLKVRDLKAAKAPKEEITAAVAELLRLKKVCGE